MLNPSGTLSLGSVDALGLSTLTINGGVLTGSKLMAENATYNVTGDFTIGTGTSTVGFGAGNVTLSPATGNSITLTLNSTGASTIDGPISANPGTSLIIKGVGAGTGA